MNGKIMYPVKKNIKIGISNHENLFNYNFPSCSKCYLMQFYLIPQ